MTRAKPGEIMEQPRIPGSEAFAGALYEERAPAKGKGRKKGMSKSKTREAKTGREVEAAGLDHQHEGISAREDNLY